jgi:hypothetical protein
MKNFLTKGARPIESTDIGAYYKTHEFVSPSLEEYSLVWRQWLQNSTNKSLIGLKKFIYADYTQGTSQTFDHFVLRHSGSKEIVNFIGDFQYHSCISKKLNFRILKNYKDLHSGQALILSIPFSDYGKMHPDMDHILDTCNRLNIPVCIDLAYWGISKNIHLDLDKYHCITEVTSSLSKSFYTLENHRVGIRFSKDYLDDGISMLNEVRMQNFYSMSLGIHYMQKFSADWNWHQHSAKYSQICQELELEITDTIIFGLSINNKYSHLNRGIPDNHRVCVSSLLKENINDC